ncbi:MAG: hypothetical protein EBR32_06050, partial [Bacteroidetes bacterium]|nr:hypothetical protein [Bacteroidota bacterium]
MKNRLIIILVAYFSVSGLNTLKAQTFTLADNQKTVVCTDAEVGESGEINGVVYTKRTREE